MSGNYFFENNNGTTVTVNSDRYDHKITLFLHTIEEYNMENMRFQQDGAICYTTRANMTLLQETFSGNGMVISRRGDINCDLTPLHFYYAATRKTVFMQTLEYFVKLWLRYCPYVSKTGRKLPQKNQCLQQFARRSFKCCSVSHMISTFKLYKKKK